MRAHTLLFLVSVMACQDSGELGVIDPDGLTDDPGTDTDVNGTDTETDDPITDTDEDTDDGSGGSNGGALLRWHHLIDGVALLPSEDGFDLDGDGDADNGIGVLEQWIGDFANQPVGGLEEVIVTQMFGVGDEDPRAFFGLLAGFDADGDGDDNTSGSEVFEVSEGVQPNGRATAAVTVRIGDGGSFTGQLPAGVLPLFGFEVPTATPLKVRGKVTEGEIELDVGAGISVEAVTDLLDQFGAGWAGGFIGQAADLDTDGDNRPDALSLAVRLKGVPCDIEVVAPAP